jgi:hypothetical protein
MRTSAVVLALASLATGCTDNSDYERRLRDALDRADLGLADSVTVAESEIPTSETVRATLRVASTPVFTVDAFGSGAMHRVDVDPIGGAVLAIQDSGAAAAECESIPMTEILAIAEAEVGGEAVSAEPDDDGACNLEVQVLVGLELWEVKVGPEGAVIETEISDEDGSGEED